MTQPLMIYRVKYVNTQWEEDGNIFFNYEQAKQWAMKNHEDINVHILIQEYQQQKDNSYKCVSEWSTHEDDAMRWEWSAV